jgi:hypothetical protein
MSDNRLHQVAQFLCEQVDWSRPELAETDFAAAWRGGHSLEAALGLIRHLRGRETPVLGYTGAYVAELRAGASAAERETAGRYWEEAHARELLRPVHLNTYWDLGPETVILAATTDRCRRLAEKVLASRDRWAEGLWGVVHATVDLIRWLWRVPECAGEDLLPLFGWLLTKARVEWAESRAWDETILGTSGHNWWAHTFLGFFMLGLFFPEFTGAERFRALGGDYLDREVDILFDEDGWSKEGAPGYSLFAAGNLLRWAEMAERNGRVVADRTRAKLRRMAEAGWRLLAPDGDYPVFGDSGRPTAEQSARAPEPASLTELRRRAARFSLPEAKWVAEALSPDWQPPYGGLLAEEGRNLLPAYRRVPTVAPPAPDTALRHSGFYVMRSDWTPRADYLALVAGPLGERVTSHQHADRLGFELYARGRRLLVDNWYGPSGDPVYDPQARMWRVGSAAHNVCTVDGQDHVPVVASFLMGETILPTVDDWRAERDYAYFSGVHEGYLRLPQKVTAWRRKLFYLRGQYWIMLDRFTAPGEAEHEYQLHFHLNAPSELQADGRLLTQGAGGNLLILPVPGAAGEAALAPNPWPVADYENPDHLTYTHRARGNWLFATLMVPFTDDETPEVSVEALPVQADERAVSSGETAVSPWEITALAVTINGRRDVYVDQHMQWNLPWQAGGYQGEGRVFHSQIKE